MGEPEWIAIKLQQGINTEQGSQRVILLLNDLNES